MKKAEFLTPAVTIFDAQGNVDREGNVAVYDHLLRGGMDGIVIMGSTGEFFAMPMEQKKELIDIAAPFIKGKGKCFIGTGGLVVNDSVSDTVELSNYACEAGADAVMIVAPYYFALGAADLEAYYDAVASRVKGDIYLYNYPKCTGSDLTPEITLNLLRKHPNIKGFKDTVDCFGHTRAIIEATKDEFPDFVVLSGYDENLYHVMLSGGNGCIGGLSNFVPELFAKWCKAINEGELAVIEECQRKVNALMCIYSDRAPFPHIAKRGLTLRGVPISETTRHFSVAPIDTAKLTGLIEGALK